MRSEHTMTTGNDPTGNFFLTGAILLAQVDGGGGLGDYVIKAILGGAIWMAFKVGSEFVTDWMKKRKEKQ